MSHKAIFLTHADVVIDPDVPVPDWPLSDTGRARHAAFAQGPALRHVCRIYCSAERKARDGAEITVEILGLTPQIREELGENDRSSTGYLPKERFEQTADRFFSEPQTSIDGWERAVDAQARIVSAVSDALSEQDMPGDVLFIAHGGVATLLRCHLLGSPITRAEDQPGGSGGCWFAFNPAMTSPPTAWNLI